MAIDRVDVLRASNTLTGIDFIQVSASQTELLVFMQHDVLPAAVATALTALGPSDIVIEGEGQVDPHRVAVLQNVSPLPPPVDGRAVMRLVVDRPGGFGYYRLKLGSTSIDPYYNDVRFTFKAACDSELDCKAAEPDCPVEPAIDFAVDYRARDFWSFRQALIDFAAQRYPDWQDRLEADVGMMVLELLAALGDEFAYAQDRLARENTLATATQRRSLRHLARLVDYPLDDGSGAFTWLDVQALAAVTLPAGTAVCDAQSQIVFELGKGLRDTPIGSAALQYPIDPARNSLLPYIWDEHATCLEAGSTTLALQGAHAALLMPEPVIDVAGRWLLFHTRPVSPDVPERRLMVRLSNATPPVDDIDPLTALPITRITWDAPTPWQIDLDTLVVRGNLLPATAGETATQRFRIGPVDDPLDPEPHLPLAVERIGIDSTLCYPDPGTPEDDASRVKFLFPLPDSEVTPLVWLPTPTAIGIRMSPEVALARDGDGMWPWLDALVGETTALPTDKVFTLEDGVYRRVVGFEHFGALTQLVDYASSEGNTIRFGDGEFGTVPSEHSKFTVRYRLGNGSRTNVAPDTLVVFKGSVPAGVDPAVGVTNPLPGLGGRDPETSEDIRINAPEAFRATTYRAVQPDDYARIAERLEWVQKAGATVRWTGSWSTVFVTPDPRDEVGLSRAHRSALEQLIDRVRQAGREAKVMDPRYADIDLEIHLCVAPDAYRGEVKQAALIALFGRGDRRGDEGFFDPDRFTFGTALSRAALIAALQAVPGVRAVEAMRVRRRGWFDWRDFVEFSLPVGVDELVRVANDRDLPERGAVRLLMEGGA